MSEPSLNKFNEAIKPFLPLWQSIRVSGMALNTSGQWTNIGIRIQFRENLPINTNRDRVMRSLDQHFLYYEVDYPLEFSTDIIGQLVNDGFFVLGDTSQEGGAYVQIFLKSTQANLPGRNSTTSWHGPSKNEPTLNRSIPKPLRTSIVLSAFGDMLDQVLDQDSRRKIDSKLRLVEPGYDGLAGLSRHLFPGVGFENWQMPLAEIVAELPFELESLEVGKFSVRASSRISDGLLTARCFYDPQLAGRPPLITFRRETGHLLDPTQMQWEHPLEWPDGSSRTKITLFYKDEEIQSLQLNRQVSRKPSFSNRTRIQQERPTTASRQPSPTNSKEMPVFKTALETYFTLGIVGTGGSGVVYKVQTDDAQTFAIKRLDAEKATTQKRKRFKIELHFCLRNNHKNIVTVLDHGITSINGEECPFYVMPYYSETLRDLMKKGIPPKRVLTLFSYCLDGVEAAHLKNVWHRDLKPENILYDPANDSLIVADFGIAHFGEEMLYTLIETGSHDRLANFQYAAPEQRARGHQVDHRSDIYALGVILNEMFTNHILQGAGYKRIGHVTPEFSYLDEIVERMVQQSSENRPFSIDEIKKTLMAKNNDFISRQKLDQLRQEVVPSSTAIGDWFVANPIKVVQVDISENSMIISLSSAPPPKWLRLFVRPTSGAYVSGAAPENWKFNQDKATVSLHPNHLERQSKLILDNFKIYVERANALYQQQVEREARQREEDERRSLKEQIIKEERRQRILRDLKV